jgi:MarR family transcriptional regulator, temperature-dependent positive regulator of motility
MAAQHADRLESEAVLGILRELKKSPELTQRELSSRLGISLGKVNFLINTMIRQDLVKTESFKTSRHKNAYLYYLTPRGIKEKARTTSVFLNRKIKECRQLEEEIRQLQVELMEIGISSDDRDKGASQL